jgi:hypothetical protein
LSAPTRLIAEAEPRTLFEGLVREALGRTRVEATPLAAAYLVDLLDAGVGPAGRHAVADAETFAEGLLRARRARGPGKRMRRLRGLGDRALFVAGLFGESLVRRGLGLGYYADAGRIAYAEVCRLLAPSPAQRDAARLFEELADRFADFADVLAEVGDATRPGAGGLAGLYQRCLRHGRETDWRRLLRRGAFPILPASAKLQ